MKNLKYFLFAIAVLTFVSCEKTVFEPEPQNNPVDMFDNLWSTFNTDYPNFEQRGVNWQEQYDIYRPQVNNNTSDAELLDIFKQMLATLDDGHVSITVPNADQWYSNTIINDRIDNDLFNLELIKTKYMNNNYLESGYGGNTYGWIGNIGYYNIAWIQDNFLDIDDILNYFSTAEGLIVDMRHNGGGDFTWAFSEFGRFTNEKRFVFQSRTVNGPNPGDFTDWWQWDIEPSGTYFDKPIVMLTDRYTISAGERTVMAFNTLPNVTQMGDTTCGAIATVVGKVLPNGWYYTLVIQQTEFSNGVDYEGTGIPPQVYVQNTSEEMDAGVDNQLNAALEQLK
jgi:carboxyl-terminal processing protease